MVSVTKDAIDCVALVMTVFNIFVYCPILIHYLVLYRHYEKKGAETIHQRNSFLVYTINILAIATNCTERVFMVSSEVWGIIHVPFWAVSCFLAVCWWALMDLFAIKVYDLYYRQALNQSIADRLWKAHINPEIDDWYIVNRQKYGNSLYLIKIVLIPYLISVFLDAGLFAFLLGGGLFLNLSHLTLATIPTCIALYVFWKARKLDDAFKIRNEILYQFIIVLSALTVWMVIFIVCQYGVSHGDVLAQRRHHDNIHRFEWMSYLFITDTVTFALALFSTLYPVYLSRQHQHETNLLDHFVENSVSSPSTSCAQGVQGINSVIRDYRHFKVFIEHLVSEFCPENMLFLVELVQIKHAYAVRNNNVVRIPKQSVVSGDMQIDQKDDSLFQVIDFNVYPEDTDIDTEDCIYSYIFHDGGTIRNQIIMTSKIPSSAILSETPNDLFLQMKRLYEKYVKFDSEYELNIPFAMRNGLVQRFEMEKADEVEESLWFNVMDLCCAEVIELLCYSFRRFVNMTEKGELPAPTPASLDDVAMKNMLNSGALPVFRNVSSYAVVKQKYSEHTQPSF